MPQLKTGKTQRLFVKTNHVITERMKYYPTTGNNDKAMFHGNFFFFKHIYVYSAAHLVIHKRHCPDTMGKISPYHAAMELFFSG